MQSTKRESLQLTQDMSGIISQDVYPDTSLLKAFLDLFRYRVPNDQKLIFSPKDTFSLLALKLAEGVFGAIADDGGAQTNETVAANSATANDMHLFPAVPAVNDAFYFGYLNPFSLLKLKIGTAGVGTWTAAWEYYNGSAWVALPGLTDGTVAFTAAAGDHNVTFSIPSDWAKTAILGFSGYWIRARVATYSAVTTQPLGTQAWINSATELNSLDKIRIEVRDSGELHKQLLIPVAQYRQVTDFQDPNKLYKLDISENAIANENCWVVIMVKADAPVDVSECYFALTCDRERYAIVK